MNSLYKSPLRVYLLLGCLALLGIFSGLRLPISLFPNSAKPKIVISINYGAMTADEFLNTYGRNLEGRLKSVSFSGHEIEKVTASYGTTWVTYNVEFQWGAPPREALKEVEIEVNTITAQLPTEVRDSVRVSSRGENAGFLAVSFYSQKRSLDELYKYLDPILSPHLAHIEDASEIDLWNPNRKEVKVELDPEKIAMLQLSPRIVADAVTSALNGSSGGEVSVGLNRLNVSIPKQVETLDDLAQVIVTSPMGRTVHLREIARIDFAVPSNRSNSFKTSGAPSLILFASPRPGGNIKRMSEDVLNAIEQNKSQFPADVQYKSLVDPSEFIRSAVNNVIHEVFLAALLATAVLFLFIGNLKNVITASIEIPMSIIMAFIFMKVFGINLNLISLGGLALSAGMNVDASVVVMENIFRHFHGVTGDVPFQRRFELVCKAVGEVRFPIIASTIASLVVFIPLAFTSALTNAILGDLALAVVFSHGISAVVALVLVPTVRLHLMGSGEIKETHSPVEGAFKKIEHVYRHTLDRFMKRPRLQIGTYAGLIFALILLVLVVTPRLPREIIGTPDTDWISLVISTQGNTVTKQMEDQAQEVEARLLKNFGSSIQYTFSQVWSPNGGEIMARLKDKKEMTEIWRKMEAEFPNTPFIRYTVDAWNPSELPIPHPDNLKITVRGSEKKERERVTQEITDMLEDKQFYSRVSSEPNVNYRESVKLVPNREQWSYLQSKGVPLSTATLADLTRVATTGRSLGRMSVDGILTDIQLTYPKERIRSVEDLGALPIGIDGKLVPLKALVHPERVPLEPNEYREDERTLSIIRGSLKKEDEPQQKKILDQAESLVKEWWKTHQSQYPTTSVTFDDPQTDLNSALYQLQVAIALSILLIFLTMVLQFGDFVNALLVLVAVPLGFIGSIAALFIFKSTLSLNSVLGIILLNGIAVANSIILVDFLKRLVDSGMKPHEAALESAQKRLRPILMTSMTTALGMLPVAIGLGEGGRILQPLGIAVIGGLGVSMFLTLFIVPTLQVAYLNWKNRKLDPPSRAPAPTRVEDEDVQDNHVLPFVDRPYPPRRPPEITQ